MSDYVRHLVLQIMCTLPQWWKLVTRCIYAFFNKKFQSLPSRSNPLILKSISATTWKWLSAIKSSRNLNSDYMWYENIYAAHHYTDTNLEQSGRSERKKSQNFLEVWLWKLVLTIPVYLKLLRNINLLIPTSALWV